MDPDLDERPVVSDEDDGPSFDDLLYDDTLSDLERIGRYAVSAVALQRLVHVKLMGETARAVGCVLPPAAAFPRAASLARRIERVRGIAHPVAQLPSPRRRPAQATTRLVAARRRLRHNPLPHTLSPPRPLFRAALAPL